MKALLLSSLLLLAFSDKGPTRDEAQTAYTDALARTCGPKQLEMLPPTELKMQVDSFTSSFSPDQMQTVKHATDAACHKADNQVSCRNAGFLQAILPMNRMDAFVLQVCALPRTCRGYGDCKATS